MYSLLLLFIAFIYFSKSVRWFRFWTNIKKKLCLYIQSKYLYKYIDKFKKEKKISAIDLVCVRLIMFYIKTEHNLIW